MGFAQATSTPAVGWRCTEVVPHRGIITVQAHGDYRLLQAGKILMLNGAPPATVLSALQTGDAFVDFRQIAILTPDRRISFSGPRTLPWSGSVETDDHIAIGNVLVGETVVQAMSAAFMASAGQDLQDRLMLALEAGRDAGGQPDGQMSSALVVYDRYDFPIVNLRVDMSLEPVSEMRRNFDWFSPLVPYYIQRTLDPSSVPRYKQVLRDKNLPLNPF